MVLHTARRCRNGLGPSPFPIKLETYMRAAGIKYSILVPKDFLLWVKSRVNVLKIKRYAVDYESPRSAKGKVPWISAGGEDVADSQLAIEFLAEKFGKVRRFHTHHFYKNINNFVFFCRTWKQT